MKTLTEYAKIIRDNIAKTAMHNASCNYTEHINDNVEEIVKTIIMDAQVRERQNAIHRIECYGKDFTESQWRNFRDIVNRDEPL
jgi:hypothetical protein